MTDVLAASTDAVPDVVPPAPRRVGGWPPTLTTAVIVVALVVVWELAARTVLAGSYVLAPPSAIVGQVAGNRDLYVNNLRHTLANAALGFVWGNVAALVLAVVAALVPPLRRVVMALALTVVCLPLVAVAPILRVVLGPGDAVPIALSALAVFFTTLVAALLGLRSAPAGALELVRAYGRGRFAAFGRVRVPAAIPALMAGLQIAAPAAFLGALVGEFAGASSGFGILTIQALRTLETDQVWSVAVVSTVVSCVAYVGIGALGRRLCPWAPDIDLTAPVADGGRRRVAGTLLNGLTALVAVLVLWEAFLRVFDVNSYFAKTPADVWEYLVSGPGAAARRAIVFDAMGETARTAALGFTVGIVGAVLLAALFVTVPAVERALLPVAVALRSVPIVATTPLIILLLGRGIVGPVVIVAIMSFFPTLVNCVFGMRRTPGQVLDVLRSYNAGPVSVLGMARLPSAVPAILASARIAVPASLLGVTVAEWLATGRGIGNLMVIASSTARYDTLWACVAVLTLFAVICYSAVAAIESIVLRWMAPERSA